MKNVLITGASRGIGKATAERFLEEGYRVYACSRNISALQPLKQAFPETCFPIHLDFLDEKSIQDLTFFIQEMGGGLDIVIQNAGHLVNKPFIEVLPEELFACYAVNILGPYQLQQKLIQLLNKGSHTVFISSMGGFQGSVKFPGLTAYSTSKAAAASLAECLQAEFEGYSHSFNCLCLGSVQTEMLHQAFPGYQAPLKSEHMASYIYHFSTTSHQFLRGKVLPVSLSTP